MSGPPPGVLRLFRARLDHPPRPRGELAALLSPGERQRAARFRFDRDRVRHEVSTGLLRVALGAVVGEDPARLTFETGAHGKPFLPDGPAFNQSHSGDWWLLGVAAEGNVGVDVEVHRELRDLEELARRTFHPREAADVLARRGDERRRAFFRVWSRKEAFIKAVGAGLAYPLDGFVVAADAEPARILLDVDDPERRAESWCLLTAGWEPGLEAAVAWDRPGARIEWHPLPGVGA